MEVTSSRHLLVGRFAPGWWHPPARPCCSAAIESTLCMVARRRAKPDLAKRYRSGAGHLYGKSQGRRGDKGSGTTLSMLEMMHGKALPVSVCTQREARPAMLDLHSPHSAIPSSIWKSLQRYTRPERIRKYREQGMVLDDSINRHVRSLSVRGNQ